MLFLASLNSTLNPYIKVVNDEIGLIISGEFINNIAEGVCFGGKRIRPIILILISKILGGRNEKQFLNSAIAVELIHLASLLHDDVVDQSNFRHKKQTAHLLFGNQQVILGGDYLFAESFKKIVQTENLEVIKTLASATSILASGELEQLQSKINHQTTIQKYFEIIYKKTASLFEASTGIAGIIQNNNTKQVFDFGKNVGMAFQIIDDLLDYSSSKTGKMEGADFFEGKITLPIILANQNKEYQKLLHNLFTKEEKTKDDFNEVKNILLSSGAIDECKKIALNYIEDAKNFLNNFSSQKETKLMLEIMDFFIKRTI